MDLWTEKVWVIKVALSVPWDMYLHDEKRLVPFEEVSYDYGAEVELGCLSLLLEKVTLLQVEVPPGERRKMG